MKWKMILILMWIEVVWNLSMFQMCWIIQVNAFTAILDVFLYDSNSDQATSVLSPLGSTFITCGKLIDLTGNLAKTFPILLYIDHKRQNIAMAFMRTEYLVRLNQFIYESNYEKNVNQLEECSQEICALYHHRKTKIKRMVWRLKTLIFLFLFRSIVLSLVKVGFM